MKKVVVFVLLLGVMICYGANAEEDKPDNHTNYDGLNDFCISKYQGEFYYTAPIKKFGFFRYYSGSAIYRWNPKTNRVQMLVSNSDILSDLYVVEDTVYYTKHSVKTLYGEIYRMDINGKNRKLVIGVEQNVHDIVHMGKKSFYVLRDNSIIECAYDTNRLFRLDQKPIIVDDVKSAISYKNGIIYRKNSDNARVYMDLDTKVCSPMPFDDTCQILAIEESTVILSQHGLLLVWNGENNEIIDVPTLYSADEIYYLTIDANQIIIGHSKNNKIDQFYQYDFKSKAWNHLFDSYSFKGGIHDPWIPFGADALSCIRLIDGVLYTTMTEAQLKLSDDVYTKRLCYMTDLSVTNELDAWTIVK